MRLKTVLVSLTCLIILGSCTKDQDDMDYRAADITFRTDSGYTYLNATVPLNDTLLIGTSVAEGSEQLHTVFVQTRVNGGAWVQKDSIPFTQNPMEFDVQAIMGDAPRAEDWSILAVERNGDATRRILSFTVVE